MDRLPRFIMTAFIAGMCNPTMFTCAFIPTERFWNARQTGFQNKLLFGSVKIIKNYRADILSFEAIP